MKIGWHHQTYQTGEWDGFNDSGIETFRDDPLLHLARETIQNAVDARLSNKKPISVSFNIHTIETKTIPGFNELHNAVKACALEPNNKDNQKASNFFENALALLAKDKMTILTIEDSNTTGIKGPCENQTAYHAFMKAKGLSHKESEVASGSYGIGKLAPYAVSELRTVFVSTIYKDGDNFSQLTQGKTILTSHKNKKQEVKSSIGFWGNTDGCMPLEKIPSVESWVLNATSEAKFAKKQGTKLIILAFDADRHWQEVLACSVVENFFGAIAQSDLVVQVGNKYKLDANSIKDFFSCDAILNLLDDPQPIIDPESFYSARTYYFALEAQAENIIESQMTHLKHCKLNLLVDENLPKKVCILRNGMFITDSLKGLIRFPDFKDFAAVFQCDNDEGNKLLRRMEPTTHNNFIPNLLPKGEIKKGQKALDEIARWIRTVLRDKARDPVSDKTPLDELKDLLGDEDVSGSNPKGDEVNPMGKVIYQGKPIPITSHRFTPVASDGHVNEDSGTELENGSGGGGATGAGKGDEQGGKGGIQGSGHGGGGIGRPVELRSIRAPLLPTGQRKISFIPSISSQLVIKILEAGADADYPVCIISADQGSISNGDLMLDCKADTKTTVLVELGDSFNGAIKVVANEI